MSENSAAAATLSSLSNGDSGEEYVNVTMVTTSSSPQEDEYYKQLADQLFIIIIPFITVLGIVGNILSFLVMRRKSLRSSSWSLLIRTLAVADSAVLLLDFLNNWIEMVAKVDVLKLSRTGCTIYRYLFDVTYTFAAWLVVTLAVERFIVVWFPFRAKVLCTQKVTVGVICSLLIIIALVYSYQIVMWDLDQDGLCNIHTDHLYMMSNIHPWLTGTLYSYAPTIILIFCTTGVVIQLRRMKKHSSEMSSPMKNETNSEMSSTTKKEMRITVTVILICVLFLLFTIPLTAFYIILFAAGGHVYQGPEMALVETIILILALTNHAINFFLYVMSSAKFREGLRDMLCRAKSAESAGASHSTSSATRLSSVSKDLSHQDISTKL